MSNASANRDIANWAANLRAIEGATPAMAQQVAAALPGEIAKAVAKKQSLNGEPWPATKDGKPPLVNMAKHVAVKAYQTAVTMTLTGVEVWHHFGTHRTPQRKLWDQGPLTGISVGNAIRLGILKVSKEWLERKGSHRAGQGSMGVPSVDA